MIIYYAHEFCGPGIPPGYSGVSYRCSTVWGLTWKTQARDQNLLEACSLICLMLALSKTSAGPGGWNPYIQQKARGKLFNSLAMDITQHFSCCLALAESLTKSFPRSIGKGNSVHLYSKVLEKHAGLKIMLCPFQENIICHRTL